jgi:hypothetical protein
MFLLWVITQQISDMDDVQFQKLGAVLNLWCICTTSCISSIVYSILLVHNKKAEKEEWVDQLVLKLSSPCVKEIFPAFPVTKTMTVAAQGNQNRSIDKIYHAFLLHDVTVPRKGGPPRHGLCHQTYSTLEHLFSSEEISIRVSFLISCSSSYNFL